MTSVPLEPPVPTGANMDRTDGQGADGDRTDIANEAADFGHAPMLVWQTVLDNEVSRSSRRRQARAYPSARITTGRPPTKRPLTQTTEFGRASMLVWRPLLDAEVSR